MLCRDASAKLCSADGLVTSSVDGRQVAFFVFASVILLQEREKKCQRRRKGVIVDSYCPFILIPLPSSFLPSFCLPSHSLYPRAISLSFLPFLLPPSSIPPFPSLPSPFSHVHFLPPLLPPPQLTKSLLPLFFYSFSLVRYLVPPLSYPYPPPPSPTPTPPRSSPQASHSLDIDTIKIK